MLTRFGMKQTSEAGNGSSTSDRLGLSRSFEHESQAASPTNQGFRPDYNLTRRASFRVYKGAKRIWKKIDNEILKPNFGGSTHISSAHAPREDDDLGNYELGNQYTDSDSEEEAEKDYKE